MVFGLKTLVFFLMLSTSGWSSEIDSFTYRYRYQLKDTQNLIHQKANQLLSQAIQEANRKDFKRSRMCSEKQLYKSLRKRFKNHISGKLTPYIIKNKDVDKFEHLFGRGFKYFQKYYLQKKPLEEIFKFGHRSERIFLGANTTGVYSYGDLAANFNGMRFWNHMLGKNDDILGEEYNIQPYIICDDGRWVQNNDINFLHYIDHSFDEAINCSKLRTKSLYKKVLKQIRFLEETEGKSFQCPIDSSPIPELLEKYQAYKNKILNFDGLGSLKPCPSGSACK